MSNGFRNKGTTETAEEEAPPPSRALLEHLKVHFGNPQDPLSSPTSIDSALASLLQQAELRGQRQVIAYLDQLYNKE